MIIEKVINNNVLSAFDDQHREIVLMGKGIGFKKKAGQVVEEDQVDKIFVLNSEDQLGQFSQLVQNLPHEHLAVSLDIIDYARQVLTKRLNPSIYITLTDHINFAIDRFKQGMQFPNALLLEVRSFYPSEYLIGEYAISLIKKQLGVALTVDEAASIALHIVNAEYNTGMSEIMSMTTLIKEVVDLVEAELGTELDEGSLYYSRFVTHLKFLAQRVFTGQLLDNQEQEFIDMIQRLYPKEFACSQKVRNYIVEQYSHEVTKEELAYLTVHIRRIQPVADQGE